MCRTFDAEVAAGSPTFGSIKQMTVVQASGTTVTLTMVSTSSPSEKMASFFVGSSPRDRHQAMASSPPAIGS